jgi:uncharacterized membrane protein YccC
MEKALVVRTLRLPAQTTSFQAHLMVNLAIFVSKRLQRIAFALLCLMAVQLAVAMMAPTPVPPGAVRIPIHLAGN